MNVTVRDRNGNPVRDLKREDFTVLEDNKPQQVISFDLENTDAVLSTAATEAPLLGKPRPQTTAAPQDTLATRPLKDRRLIILFFDLSSMQPDEVDRATTAAQNYVEKQMVAADLLLHVVLRRRGRPFDFVRLHRAEIEKQNDEPAVAFEGHVAGVSCGAVVV